MVINEGAKMLTKEQFIQTREPTKNGYQYCAAFDIVVEDAQCYVRWHTHITPFVSLDDAETYLYDLVCKDKVGRFAYLYGMSANAFIKPYEDKTVMQHDYAKTELRALSYFKKPYMEKPE